MGFIMPYYKNDKRRLNAAMGVALAMLSAVGAARADFGMTMVHSEVVDNSIRFTAVLTTALNPQVAEAIDKGIPVEVIVDVLLEEHRKIWWDPDLMDWELRRRVQYHALSKQYLVHGFGIASEGFDDLTAALKHLGTFKEMKLAVPERLKSKGDYRLYLRARLDIESLPAPLRPVAYTSSAWRLNTGWKKWKVGY